MAAQQPPILDETRSPVNVVTDIPERRTRSNAPHKRAATPIPPEWTRPSPESARGLTSEEASRRLGVIGRNEPGGERKLSAFAELAVLLTNPLVVILVVAALVSVAVGEHIDAVIIIIMVVLSTALNFALNFRSQKAADRLRKLVAPTATVLRDGAWKELPRAEVVPGDVIRLGAGDLIPADARLLEAHNLHVQEAALTGESLPAQKQAVSPGAAPVPDGDQRDLVYLGTSVVSGTATALVIATGPYTEFGDITARLASRAPETEFDRGIRRFGYLIMRAIFFLVLFVFLVSIAVRHDPFESLLFAIALAVGLTPEFLPMITTVTLAQGALAMSRQKVIVKHLSSIQNFGSIDILCSDKTGTITSAEMVVERSVDAFGQRSDRALQLAEVNSTYQAGLRSPLDDAILRAAPSTTSDYAKLDELPFDFERRRLSVVVEGRGQRMLVTKGAPEGILPLSVAVEAGGTAQPMDDASRARCADTFEQLDQQGLRVLAIAYRDVPQQQRYTAADERDLTLAGYVAFADPPLPDAAEMLAALRRDGVEVKILTGDGERVAAHICAEVGLDASSPLLGVEIDRMSDTALGQVAERTSIFARVSPAQKSRILLSLKRRGHVVGFLGDGINDAPSLHAADVGISVASGADVAKDAADIILLQPGLGVLHTGILAGRKSFGNVMKYLLMGTSSNFGNMFSMAGASFFLPFLPMLPTQILLNNFLYDLAQVTIPTDNVDETYIRKPHHWDISLIRNFMIFIGPISSIYDFLTFFVLLSIFRASPETFHTGWFVESLATQTLVLFIIRTVGNPLRSRPSRPLTITTLAIVAIGALLPFSPFAIDLGFVPLPFGFFAFLVVATATYLVLVQIGKTVLMRRLKI